MRPFGDLPATLPLRLRSRPHLAGAAGGRPRSTMDGGTLAAEGAAVSAESAAPTRARARRWIRFPVVPIGLSLLLAAFVFVPPVSEHDGLRWSFLGASGFLLGWTAILSAFARRSGRVLG